MRVLTLNVIPPFNFSSRVSADAVSLSGENIPHALNYVLKTKRVQEKHIHIK